jgi:hypothetical protein
MILLAQNLQNILGIFVLAPYSLLIPFLVNPVMLVEMLFE